MAPAKSGKQAGENKALIAGQLRLGGIDVGDLLTDYRWWAAPIVLFFVARGTMEDGDDANAFLATLAYVTFVIGALTWMDGIEFRDRRAIEDQRVPGVLGQPNTMGAFLASLSPADGAAAQSDASEPPANIRPASGVPDRSVAL